LIDLDKLKPQKVSKAVKSIKQSVRTTTYQDEPVTEVKTEFQLWDKQDALWRLVELRGDKPAEKRDVTIRGIEDILRELEEK
jgi:transposase